MTSSSQEMLSIHFTSELIINLLKKQGNEERCEELNNNQEIVASTEEAICSF